jgi:DUF4097 and DUF4098 domain-containing protein YvlB
MEPTTYKTPGTLRLEINVPSGDVSVDAEAISTTTLEISGERDPDDVSVIFEPEGDGHRLRVEQRKRKLFSADRARDLKVRVTSPEGTLVTVRGGSTDLVTRGSLGSLSFHAGSGDASVEVVKGDAEAKVASGDLQIQQVGGNLSFHGASGDIRAGRVNGRATARTVSGDVQIDSVADEVKVTTVSGDITLSRLLHGGRTNLQAVSGDIDVGVPSGISVHLDLSSTSGSTDSDLDVSDSPSTAHDHEGEADIRASTVSGDIKVRRAQ